VITQSYLLRDHKGTFDIRSGTLLLRKNDTFLFANYTEKLRRPVAATGGRGTPFGGEPDLMRCGSRFRVPGCR
jgi:hypothetical protein